MPKLRDGATARAPRWIPPEPPNATHKTVAAMLTADDVDAATIAKLATRESYSDAAAELLRAFHMNGNQDGGLIADLFAASATFLPGRVAGHMGVIKRNANPASVEMKLTTLADIRHIAASSPRRALKAKIALAILGEPVAPFGELSRRERAGLLLGLLVAAFRERAT